MDVRPRDLRGSTPGMAAAVTKRHERGLRMSLSSLLMPRPRGDDGGESWSPESAILRASDSQSHLPPALTTWTRVRHGTLQFTSTPSKPNYQHRVIGPCWCTKSTALHWVCLKAHKLSSDCLDSTTRKSKIHRSGRPGACALYADSFQGFASQLT